MLTPTTERALHAMARALGGVTPSGVALLVNGSFSGRSYASQLAELFAWPVFECHCTPDTTAASVSRLVFGVRQYGSLLLLQRIFVVSGQVLSVLAAELAKLYSWAVGGGVGDGDVVVAKQDGGSSSSGGGGGGGGGGVLDSYTVQFGIMLGGFGPQDDASNLRGFGGGSARGALGGCGGGGGACLPSSVGRFFRPVAVTRPANLDLVRFLLVAYGFETAYELGSIFCKVQDVMSTMVFF